MTRLFTVRVETGEAKSVGFNGPDMWPIYECDLAGFHFSRDNEAELIKWVRVAAKHIYGPKTQVIFLHTERTDQ